MNKNIYKCLYRLSIAFGILILLNMKLIAQTSGTFIDERDNRTYSWVKIGNQTWMAENLAYLPELTKLSNYKKIDPTYYVYGYFGTDINEAKSTDNFNLYGVLYNWEAALLVCPKGWHLPKRYEWEELARNASSMFGGNYVASQMGWSQIGKPLKSVGTIEEGDGLWNYSFETNTGTDLFGFSGVPGGRLTRGNFASINAIGVWWAQDERTATAAYTAVLNYSQTMFYVNAFNKADGLSIRCLKD